MTKTGTAQRFEPGQRLVVTRSGHACGDSLAEVLQVVAAQKAEVYRVRWQDGLETYFAPGPEVCDRRRLNLGPPPGVPERRRG